MIYNLTLVQSSLTSTHKPSKEGVAGGSIVAMKEKMWNRNYGHATISSSNPKD